MNKERSYSRHVATLNMAGIIAEVIKDESNNTFMIFMQDIEASNVECYFINSDEVTKYKQKTPIQDLAKHVTYLINTGKQPPGYICSESTWDDTVLFLKKKNGACSFVQTSLLYKIPNIYI